LVRILKDEPMIFLLRFDHSRSWTFRSPERLSASL
jgi:hypothetical protein